MIKTHTETRIYIFTPILSSSYEIDIDPRQPDHRRPDHPRRPWTPNDPNKPVDRKHTYRPLDATSYNC